jgi:biotin carboxyl carrier protein
MKYLVRIDGVETTVDVSFTLAGDPVARIDGEELEIDAVAVPGGVSLRIGAHVYDVMLGGPPDATTLAAGGRRAVADVDDGRRARRTKAGRGGSSDREIRAPMPGKITKILVAPGDTVAAGDPVIVIEAMKMENELRAPADAKVDSIAVAEGQNVERAALLVSFV